MSHIIEEEPKNSDVLINSLWCLSNLAAGTQDQISALAKHPVLYQRLLHLSDTHTPPKIRHEAIMTLTNLISQCNDDELLISLIEDDGYRLLQVVLEVHNTNIPNI